MRGPVPAANEVRLEDGGICDDRSGFDSSACGALGDKKTNLAMGELCNGVWALCAAGQRLFAYRLDECHDGVGGQRRVAQHPPRTVGPGALTAVAFDRPVAPFDRWADRLLKAHGLGRSAAPLGLTFGVLPLVVSGRLTPALIHQHRLDDEVQALGIVGGVCQFFHFGDQEHFAA